MDRIDIDKCMKAWPHHMVGWAGGFLVFFSFSEEFYNDIVNMPFLPALGTQLFCAVVSLMGGAGLGLGTSALSVYILSFETKKKRWLFALLFFLCGVVAAFLLLKIWHAART